MCHASRTKVLDSRDRLGHIEREEREESTEFQIETIETGRILVTRRLMVTQNAEVRSCLLSVPSGLDSALHPGADQGDADVWGPEAGP